MQWWYILSADAYRNLSQWRRVLWGWRLSENTTLRTSASRSPRLNLTLVDLCAARDAVELVEKLDRGRGCDELAERIESLFRIFSPDERTLQRASLFQQEYVGTGGPCEFCTTIVYAVLLSCVTELAPRIKPNRPHTPPPGASRKNAAAFPRTASCPQLSCHTT